MTETSLYADEGFPQLPDVGAVTSTSSCDSFSDAARGSAREGKRTWAIKPQSPEPKTWGEGCA